MWSMCRGVPVLSLSCLSTVSLSDAANKHDNDSTDTSDNFCKTIREAFRVVDVITTLKHCECSRFNNLLMHAFICMASPALDA